MNSREIRDEKLKKEKSKNSQVAISAGSATSIVGATVAIVGLGHVSLAGGILIGLGIAGSAAYKGVADIFHENRINKEFADEVYEDHHQYMESTKDIRYENEILKKEIASTRVERNILKQRSQSLYNLYNEARVTKDMGSESQLYEASDEDKSVGKERDENKAIFGLYSREKEKNVELSKKNQELEERNNNMERMMNEIIGKLKEQSEELKNLQEWKKECDGTKENNQRRQQNRK